MAFRSAQAWHRDIGVVRHRKKSGDVVFVHLTAHTVEFSQREAVMVMAIDVTAEVLSKRALERLYGMSPAAMMANPDLWIEVVHPEDVGIARASHAALQAAGESSCEYRICLPSGEVKWVSDRKAPHRRCGGAGGDDGGILEDISAVKAHEAMLLAQRTAELMRVNSELDAFARTIAHDLRAPLVSVVGFTQLLQKRYGAEIKEDGARLMARIERSAQQMASLVTVLLALSRVSTTVLAIGDVDLVPIAREIWQEFQDQEPHRQLRFESPPSLQVRADPALVRPLLASLLGNAWKFTGKRDDACIRLRLEVGGTERVVCVQDNGAGFDASQPELLFKPFQRFHSLCEFSGTGIGLTTCERIIARHHGRIWLQSAPGEGTSVFVTFAPPAVPPLTMT